MNCSQVKYQILENKSGKSNGELKTHLESCENCKSFAENYSKSIYAIKSDFRTQNDEFFYNRLTAKMQNRQEKVNAGIKPKLQYLYISVLIVFAVFGGIQIGNHAKDTYNSYKEVNMDSYANALTNDITSEILSID